MSFRSIFNKFKFLQLHENKIYLMCQRDLNRVLLLMMLNFESSDEGTQFQIYQFANIQHRRLFESVKRKYVVNQILENNLQQFWAGKKHMASVESLEDHQIIQAINDLKSQKGKKLLKVLRKIIRGFTMRYPQHQQVDQIIIEYQSDRDCIELSSDSKQIDGKKQIEQIIEEVLKEGKEEQEQQEEQQIDLQLQDEGKVSQEKGEQLFQNQSQSQLQRQNKEESFNQQEQLLKQILKIQQDNRETQLAIQLSINNLIEQNKQVQRQVNQISKQSQDYLQQLPKADQQQNQSYFEDVIGKQQQCFAYQDFIQKWYISALQQQQAYLYTQLIQQQIFHPICLPQNQIPVQLKDQSLKLQDQQEQILNDQIKQGQQSPQKPNCNGKEQSDTIPKNTSDNVDTSRRNKEIQQFVPHNISLFDKEAQLPLKEYNQIQDRVQTKRPNKSFSKWIEENPHHIRMHSQSSNSKNNQNL